MEMLRVSSLLEVFLFVSLSCLLFAAAAVSVLRGRLVVKLRPLLRSPKTDRWSQEENGKRAKENRKENDERYGGAKKALFKK